jgi:NTE family protein
MPDPAIGDASAGRPPGVAVVVGSGGLKCAASIGAIEVLHAAGIPVELVVGCSGGAIFSYWLAQGWRQADVAGTFGRAIGGLFDAIDLRSVARALLPRAFGFDPGLALVDDRRLNAALHELAGDDRFADLPVPLRIVATDAGTGDTVVLSEGRVVDALRASLAIPMVLPPWRIDGRRLIDGGVTNPLPVDVAMREGAGVIVAMGFEDPIRPEVASLPEMLANVTSVTVNRLLRAQLAFHTLAHHDEVVPIVPAIDRPVGLRDVHAVPWLVERGRDAARAQLPHLERLLASRA